MFNPEVLPFDKVTELPVHHFTVQDFFYHPFLFSVDDLRRRGGAVRRPVIGSSEAGVSLTTLNTGWIRLIDGGRRRRYTLLPTFRTTGKGPRYLWDSFRDGRVVVMLVPSR
jgi:hypothetical protein